jgi:hypothetical protein
MARSRKADAENNVQARVTAYQKWVIQSLAESGGGTYALSPSAVLADMIREWIVGHQEYLRSLDLDEAHFRRPKPIPESDSRKKPIGDSAAR